MNKIAMLIIDFNYKGGRLHGVVALRWAERSHCQILVTAISHGSFLPIAVRMGD